ncbi:MAG: hypothetical protein ABI528_04045 [bacterium]
MKKNFLHRTFVCFNQNKLLRTTDLYVFLIFFGTSMFFFSCNDNSSNSNNEGPRAYDQDPCWSVDGNSIIYQSGLTREDVGIYSIDTNGLNKKEISVPEAVDGIDLSPDGLWAVYSKGGNIFKRKISNIKDTVVIQLTFEDGNYNPSWSYDGEWIAYDSNKDSERGQHFIWKMRKDGSMKKRVIGSAYIGEVRQPDWFPDGFRLAVIRYVRASGEPDVAIIDTNGNQLSYLSYGSNFFVEGPQVSNDGNFVVFLLRENGGKIMTIKSDNTNLNLLTAENTKGPHWSPDGKMIAYVNSDGRIWIMNKDGSRNRKVSY